MSKFKPGAQIEDAVSVAATASGDGQEASVLLAGMEARLGRGDGSSDIKTVSIVVPVEENKKTVKVRQDVRGFASLAPGAAGSMLFQFNGESYQLRLPLKKKGAKNNFTLTFDSTLEAGHQYIATIVLVLQHPTQQRKDDSVVSVDTIDIVLAGGKTKSSKTKKK